MILYEFRIRNVDPIKGLEYTEIREMASSQEIIEALGDEQLKSVNIAKNIEAREIIFMSLSLDRLNMVHLGIVNHMYITKDWDGYMNWSGVQKGASL